jgi:hypothetical protein
MTHASTSFGLPVSRRALTWSLGVRRFAAATLFVLLGCIFVSAAPAQSDPDTVAKLRRDQDDILRKAEHLQALMQKLLQRYEREHKAEHVKLLQEGLAHIERSGILRDVATIRDDLTAAAFTEALRKQKEVVDDLERLLNILLERKSVENLEQQMQLAAKQAATARELEQRQRDLIGETNSIVRNEPTEAERKLLEGLQSLRDAERREAERNARQSGTRRPFLESALQQVQELLRQQERLESSLADEAAGRTAGIREREFDLGSLTQRTRELQGQLRDQERQQNIGESAQKLREEAAGTDQQAMQQARDRLETQLQDAPKLHAGSEGTMQDPEWKALRDRLRKAESGASPAESAELRQIGEAAEKVAAQRNKEAGEANTKLSGELQQDAEKLAARMQQARSPTEQAAPNEQQSPADSVAEAGKRLAEAQAAAKAGATKEAQAKANQALSALERARTQHQQQSPDAAKQAAEMAATAAATGQELQNAPNAEAPEQTASKQLQQAAEALRKTEDAVQSARDAGSKPDAGQPTATSKQQLEAAKQTLEQALGKANEGNQPDLADAAQRQEQLQKATEAQQQQLGEAQKNGQITPEQQSAASSQLDKAKQHMQQAVQQLQSGKQASASGQQDAAAEALQQAMESLQQQRPLSPEQKQALQDEAKKQQELAEDIVRLAEELKKRQNKAAERAANQAADAARKAQRAMERGDEEQTQEQQEQARQKLEEAAKQLEEEKDRYQDLRQEELLFRMKEELTNLLEKQRPITAQTLEAHRTTPAEGLSRPARRKLNTAGEEEQALATKIDFLVNALNDEGNLVYQTVLRASLEDLREVARRLSGRAPDPGPYTTMLQQDVERRSEELIKALEREQKRREQERKQQQEQQQQGQNKFNPQREKLVSLIADLEMLKQLGIDTRRASDNLRTLIEARADETVSDAEVALVERLSHQHAEITALFQKIRQGIEAAMKAMEGNEDEQGGGRGR